MNHTVGTYFADVLTLILLSPGCQKRAFQTYVRKAEGRQTMPNVENVATWIRGTGSDVLLCWRLRTLSFLFCPFELPTIKSVVWIEICDTSSDSIQQSALNDSTPRITQVVKSKIKYRATTPPFSRIPKCLNLYNPWRQIQIKFSELDWHYVEWLTLHAPWITKKGLFAAAPHNFSRNTIVDEYVTDIPKARMDTRRKRRPLSSLPKWPRMNVKEEEEEGGLWSEHKRERQTSKSTPPFPLFCSKLISGTSWGQIRSLLQRRFLPSSHQLQNNSYL